MSAKPKQTTQKYVGGRLYHTCPKEGCGRLFPPDTLDNHIWSHAWSVYRQLPLDRQSGRFKQLTKFLPPSYDPSKTSKKEQKKLFYETYPAAVKQASTPSSVRSDERFGIVSETSEDNLPVLEEIATPTATAAVEPVAETTKSEQLPPKTPESSMTSENELQIDENYVKPTTPAAPTPPPVETVTQEKAMTPQPPMSPTPPLNNNAKADLVEQLNQHTPTPPPPTTTPEVADDDEKPMIEFTNKNSPLEMVEMQDEKSDDFDEIEIENVESISDSELPFEPKVEVCVENDETSPIVISDADDDVPLTEMITRNEPLSRNSEPIMTMDQQLLDDAQAYPVKPRIKQYTNGPIVDAVKKRPVFRSLDSDPRQSEQQQQQQMTTDKMPVSKTKSLDRRRNCRANPYMSTDDIQRANEAANHALRKTKRPLIIAKESIVFTTQVKMTRNKQAKRETYADFLNPRDIDVGMNNNTTMHRPNSTIQQQQHVLLVQSTDESDDVNVINKSSREALIKTPEAGNSPLSESPKPELNRVIIHISDDEVDKRGRPQQQRQRPVQQQQHQHEMNQYAQAAEQVNQRISEMMNLSTSQFINQIVQQPPLQQTSTTVNAADAQFQLQTLLKQQQLLQHQIQMYQQQQHHNIPTSLNASTAFTTPSALANMNQVIDITGESTLPASSSSLNHINQMRSNVHTNSIQTRNEFYSLQQQQHQQTQYHHQQQQQQQSSTSQHVTYRSQPRQQSFHSIPGPSSSRQQQLATSHLKSPPPPKPEATTTTTTPTKMLIIKQAYTVHKRLSPSYLKHLRKHLMTE